MRQRSDTSRWTMAGFSRVETVTTLILGTVLVAVLGHFILVQPRLAESLDTTREYMQNARVTLEVLSREVRMSGYNPTGASFDGLLVTPTTLHLKADLNGDGDTDDADEDIRYTYDSTRQMILRTDRQGQEVLAEHVRHFSVTELDETGQPTALKAQLRQLRLHVQTGTSAASPGLLERDSPQVYTLSTIVQVRNISTVIEHERG